MIKSMPVEFVRVALAQTLYEQKIKKPYLFGGDNEITITSFYEQLKNQEQVDRFTEIYRDLVNQQNRSGLIGNGIIVSPENPTITNLYTATIIPMTWSCSIRTKLSDRDNMVETINNLIDELKGSKVDMAQLECVDDNGKKFYQPFKVGTMGHNEGSPKIKCGDYVGNRSSSSSINSGIIAYNLDTTLEEHDYLYYGNNNKIMVAYNEPQTGSISIASSTIKIQQYSSGVLSARIEIVSTDTFYYVPKNLSISCVAVGVGGTKTLTGVVYNKGINSNRKLVVTYDISSSEIGDTLQSVTTTMSGSLYTWTMNLQDSSAYPNIVFPPEHNSFEKYKLSMSFDAIRVDEPRTLNGDEYCEITFGGSATLVNANVKLGNDLVKVAIAKNKILAETDITLNGTKYYVEPLEMPSGNNANTNVNQLMTNYFKQNTHTDSIAISLQYTFVVDESIDLIAQLFDYARYGTYNASNSGISPNMIFTITEWFSAWGVVQKKEVLGKIADSIDIENTEGDTLTLSVAFQVQGENN